MGFSNLIRKDGKTKVLKQSLLRLSKNHCQSVKYNFADSSPLVHISTYSRSRYRPRLVSFEKPTELYKWCDTNGQLNAINGGFFDRSKNRALGELWISGMQQDHTPFSNPWHNSRGGISITKSGHIHIGPRYELPAVPPNDLLQAGPLLVYSGQNLIKDLTNPEGFSSGNHQFDSDITTGQNPRAAIGINDRYIFTVAVDGYNSNCWGIHLKDLADIFIDLGARFALNLDGGGSASLVNKGTLVNTPTARDYTYSMCRPVYSAIIFQ